MQKVVIALGGNAILQPGQAGELKEQIFNIQRTVEQIAQIIDQGNRVVITHGNGPQVGAIMIQNDEARERVPAMPLDVCGSKSQGMLGYLIQQQLSASLQERGINSCVASVITQVRVDESDSAFENPTKPIGPFYSEDEAKERMQKTDEVWVNDANRGWRRVVPSPDPVEIVESRAIKTLVDSDTVVICTGGGGVPVVEDEHCYRGMEAVIDKDFASERLAEEIEADVLLILTDVPNVKIHYGTQNEQPLTRMNCKEAEKYLEDGQFGEGSMAPKIRACLRFVSCGKKAIITSLDRATDALKGEAGTHIVS